MADTKTIFALRREGKLDEALPLARELWNQAPADPWVIKALGWTLYSLVKREKQEGRLDQARGFLDELNKLDVPADDQMLVNSREQLRSLMDPANRMLQEAKAASKGGDTARALELFRKALEQHPDSAGIQTDLAWEIVRALKALSREENPNAEQAGALVVEYQGLTLAHQPGVLHSQALWMATSLQKVLPDYIAFVRWWNPENFQPRDFEGFTPEGRDEPLDSLVERVIKALYHAARMCRNAEDVAWAADFVAGQVSRYPKQQWFPYYHGRLLMLAGKRNEARALITEVVRQKPTEFWAWSALAETFEIGERDARRACLCKAMLCRVQDDSLRVRVHSELGEMFLGDGDLAAAKHEFQKAVQSRAEKGWGASRELQSRMVEDWYGSTEAAETNQALYQRYGAEAMDLVLGGVPWTNAVVTGVKPADDKGPAQVFLSVAQAGTMETLRVKQGRFDVLRQAEPGMPVRCKLARQGDRLTAAVVEARAGLPWDVLPARVGVITYVNTERGFTRVSFGHKEFVLVHHDRWPEAVKWQPGDFVAVRSLFNHQRQQNQIKHVTRSEFAPTEDWCKLFEGALRRKPDAMYGFVNKTIFISPPLIQTGGWEDGTMLRGVAVLEWNEKKGENTWSAVCAQKADEAIPEADVEPVQVGQDKSGLEDLPF